MRCSFLITAAILLLTACNKDDSHLQSNNPALAQDVSTFLKSKQAATSSYYSSKLQLLLDNITNPGILKVGETELLICDLEKYKNNKSPNYAYTYYKVSFMKLNGRIQFGYIYTVHTDLPESVFNGNIENILSLNYEQFTGEIVTNDLNDRFLSSITIRNGKTINVKEVKNKIGSTARGCLDYYLVTTTYYTDGSVEEQWDFLFTTCDECGPAGQPSNIEMDCPPDLDGGGSGGGSSDDLITQEVSAVSEEEDSDEDLSTTIGQEQYVQVKYYHVAHKQWSGKTGQVLGVEIYDTKAEPLVSPYVSSSGISGTRTLTLFGHSNFWQPMVPPIIRVDWNCFVHRRYVAVDGSVRTRQGHHSYFKIF